MYTFSRVFSRVCRTVIGFDVCLGSVQKSSVTRIIRVHFVQKVCKMCTHTFFEDEWNMFLIFATVQSGLQSDNIKRH